MYLPAAAVRLSPACEGGVGLLMPKTAIVTGSSQGIGRAIALRLARDGMQLVLCARNQNALDGVVREIESSNGRAIAVSLDLRAPESAPRLVSAALDSF